MPGERTREVTLDPGDLCGHSGQKPRGRGEPARTGRGPSPALCTPSPGRIQRERAAVVPGLTRRVQAVTRGRGRRVRPGLTRRVGRRRRRRVQAVSRAAGDDASPGSGHDAQQRLARIRRVGVGEPQRTTRRLAHRTQEPVPGLTAAHRTAHRVPPRPGRNRTLTPRAYPRHGRTPASPATPDSNDSSQQASAIVSTQGRSHVVK